MNPVVKSESKMSISHLIKKTASAINLLSSNLTISLKSQHYSSIIKENSGNQKVSFKTLQKLLQKPTANYYPPSETTVCLLMNLLPFLPLRLIHYVMISLLKRRLLLIRPNVLLMGYSLCHRLNFQLLLRRNLMTSGNWLQHCYEVLRLGSVTIFHYQAMYRPIASYYY